MNPGRLLLIVEDEPQVRRSMRSSLRAQGFHLVEVATAAQALLVTREHPPELIVLDLTLPDGDGVELMKRVRSFSRVPIIVISSRSADADKAALLDAGADDYLTKPFGME